MDLATLAILANHANAHSLKINQFVIDSRKVSPRDVFIAFYGNKVDGHDYIPQAVDNGAIAVIASRAHPNLPIPQFVVTDPLEFITKLAKDHRKSLDFPLIALTGSNGKTSVKEMIAAILPKPSYATAGNYNNHLGLPLSVLNLKSHHRYGVLELGANHLGEIAHMVKIAKPDVALITNVGPAHLAEFGSMENIARAKAEIYQTLTHQQTAIINNDDVFAEYWHKLIKKPNKLTFALESSADIYAKKIVFDTRQCASFILHTPEEQVLVKLAVPGLHAVKNALAASAACYAVNIDRQIIADGLKQFKGVKGRLSFYTGYRGACIIDDSYNANLTSALTAVDLLAKQPGKRILVLGDMGELGKWASDHHAQIGQAAQKAGIDTLLTYGQLSIHSHQAFGKHALHFDSQTQLAQKLLDILDNNTTVLIKGSRKAAMDKIVSQLMS